LRFVEMLDGDVGRERRLSPSTIVSAASRALSVLAVFDEPDGGMGEAAIAIILCSTQP
jgi:hypothetical protein